MYHEISWPTFCPTPHDRAAKGRGFHIMSRFSIKMLLARIFASRRLKPEFRPAEDVRSPHSVRFLFILPTSSFPTMLVWPGDSHKSLKQKFVDGWKQSCIDKKEFVPKSCLDAHITKENIEAELKRQDIVVTTKLVDFIQTKAKKLFAILVYARMPEAISGCYDHQLMDDHLPVILRKVDNVLKFFSLSENEPSDVSFEDASAVFLTDRKDGTWKWNRDRFHDFYENQWKFISPVFKRERYRYKLYRQHILPFESVGKEKGGGFSKVYPVTIHDAHQQGYSSV